MSICMLNWVLEGMEIFKGKEKEEKRLKKPREGGKEVKVMFGQMKKDGWELVGWAKRG